MADDARHSATVAARARAADVPMTEDLFRLYLDEIGRVDLLRADEEVDLAKRMRAGHRAEELLDEQPEAFTRETVLRLRRVVRDGHRAHDRMIEANLRLVVSVARRYRSAGIGFPDLVQEGNLGLLRAVDRFDPTLGYRFSTYATWWIRQTIGRGLTQQSRTIRLPSHLVELLGRSRKIERELLQQLGRDPTPEEVAAKLDVDVERLLEVRRQAQAPSSLDAPVGEDAGASMGDLLPDEHADAPADVASAALLADDLREALDGLEERDRAILEARFGLAGQAPRTLESVATELGLTRERVRQLEVRALARLRTGSGRGAERLTGYLG